MGKMAAAALYKYFLQTQKFYDLGIEHQWLSLYEFYKSDDTWLTWNYSTARSYLVSYAFKWGKRLHSHLIGKLAAINIIDRRLMFLKKMDHRGLSATRVYC